jgi:TRAP transporter 4TM/12TM fusion protein
MRRLEGFWRQGISFIAIGFAAFHLLTGMLGVLPAQEQRAVHVAFALVLVLACYPRRKKVSTKGIPIFDLLMISVIILACANIFIKWKSYMPVMSAPATVFEIVLALAATLIILEAGRRITGWVFPILIAMAIIYALFGQYIPGKFGHAPIKPISLLRAVYFSTDGIWGFLTGLSATFIALFVLFGSFLLTTGGGKTFIDLSLLGAGRLRGGPAKVAVISSGLFSMLSGSPLANVATTGSFTIPMMKKLGYSSAFAGAVEATASTGGIITPPIMGAAAFIMAEFLGISYLEVIIAASIPALLYYLAVFMGVHFQAIKRNLEPIPPEDLPSAKSVFTWSRIIGLFLPSATLLYTLLSGFSLIFVATSASLMCLVTYIFSDFSLGKMKKRVIGISKIFDAAGNSIVAVVPILVCANIFLALLEYTGLGLKFSNLIIGFGKDYLFLSLLLTGLLVMILGCGLPITAAYILGVVVAVPLLVSWGILPIAAHLFILYYSVLATITPPVCPALYLASHIAQSKWLKTAWIAMGLSPLLYIMPFLFVYNSTFLLIGLPRDIILNVGTAVLGAIILVSGTMGQLISRCNVFERIILVAAGIFLLLPVWQFDSLGAIFVFTIFVKQVWLKRTIKSRAA